MKDKDLDLGAKATQLNRERFNSAISHFGLLEILEKIRVEILGIPIDGFDDQNREFSWMNPIDQDTQEMFRRHGLVKQEVDKLLARTGLTENYARSMRHLLLQNKVGHIPGNFTIEFTFADRKIKTEYHDRPKSDEQRLENKLRNELFKYAKPGTVARRTRKNAKRDDSVDDLTRKKGVDEQITRDLSIVAEVYPPESVNDISKESDEKRAKVIKTARHRGKKRNS